MKAIFLREIESLTPKNRQMTTFPRGTRNIGLRATAGDELSLLVQLTRMETIGTRMLLRSLVEIVRDDSELVVDIVLMLTDPKRDFSLVTFEEYRTAYLSVEMAKDLPGATVLQKALVESSEKAGFVGLDSPGDRAA